MTKLFLASLLAATSAGSALADVSYSTLNYPLAGEGATYLTGIREVGSTGNVYMTGVYTAAGQSGTQGLIYQGAVTGGGTWNVVNFIPTDETVVTSTALYGPNDIGSGNIRAVGSYKTEASGAYDIGLMYQGPTDGSGNWKTLNATALDADTINTIAHSTHGGYAVGNYDTSLATGKAFIYDITNDDWINLTIDGAISVTAYGIWHNGGDSYTIAGGYSSQPSVDTLSQAYLMDWDASTGLTSNMRTYNFENRPAADVVTHFNGITGDGNGGYYLTGDYVGEGAEDGLAFFASVGRTELGFGGATWTQISYPSGSGLSVDVTSGNSVYQNYVIGIYTANGDEVPQGYVAAVPEPTTTLLIAAGGLLFFLYKRRSQLKAA